MGKLADFMAMKRDLAFEFECELRAVRNLILGISRISGSEYTIDLASCEGFVGGSRARAAFAEGFRLAAHEALVRYAHDLARESLAHGIDQEIVSNALGGVAPREIASGERGPAAPQAPHAAEAASHVRLAVCA